MIISAKNVISLISAQACCHICILCTYCSCAECPGDKRRIFTTESDVATLSALYPGSLLWPLPSLLSASPRAVWCNLVEEFTGNNVTIEFSSPVLLDTIVSRGDRQAQEDPEYVSNATIYYAPSSGADLEILQVSLPVACQPVSCMSARQLHVTLSVALEPVRCMSANQLHINILNCRQVKVSYFGIIFIHETSGEAVIGKSILFFFLHLLLLTRMV